MNTIKIRNKTTGEVKTINPQELSSYGLSSSVPTSSPSPTPTSGASPIPSLVGQTIGSVAGTPGGPIGRTALAGIGAGVGQEVAQAQAGLPGDPGAFLSLLGPAGMMARLAQKGPLEEKSPTEKAMGVGMGAQLSGETLSGLMKLLKPGTITGILNNITTKLSKNGKGIIPVDKLETRFLNETLPKALQSSGEMNPEKIVEGGKDLLKATNTKLFDPEELNFVRKQFNAIGGGKMGTLKEFLANDLARIIRDEQTKLVPSAGVSLGAERLGHQIPQILRQLPLGRLFFGAGGGSSGLTGLVGTGISKLSGLAKYGLGPLISGISKEE